MRLAWVLRAIIVATAGVHIVRGEYLFALLAATAVALLVVPAAHAERHHELPVEFDLVLLLILVGDITLGRLLRLYESSAWFDKGLHLWNSIALAFVGFLFVRVLHVMGKLRTSTAIDGVVIILVTLGLGALWEIVEFVSDAIWGYGAQGAPTMSALEDTMWDLKLDLAGGAVGAVLGPLFLRASAATRRRLEAYVARRHRGREFRSGTAPRHEAHEVSL